MRLVKSLLLSFALVFAPVNAYAAQGIEAETPPPASTPSPTSSPSPTEAEEPEEKGYISGTVSYGDIPLKESVLTVETSNGSKHAQAMSTKTQKGNWGTLPSYTFSPVEVNDDVKKITLEYPTGFTGKKTFTSNDLQRSGNTYFLHVDAEPDTGMSVKENHTTEGREYKIEYVVKNTGTAPLTITSNNDCGTFQLLGGAEHKCSTESRYYMVSEPISIAGTFTGVFTYNEENIDTLEETVTTVIDTPNANSQDTPSPTSSPEDEDVESSPESIEKSPLPSLPETQVPMEDRPSWIIFVPLMIVAISLALIVYLIRKQNRRVSDSTDETGGTEEHSNEGIVNNSEGSHLLDKQSEESKFYIRPQHSEKRKE